ncbi:Poly(ADP-ribose) glycohydrolase [Fusarium sp. LHS14.1]|nr:Poly(ADP-ribose) glycohydrolase [Fusarium sp. LHS14.1]
MSPRPPVFLLPNSPSCRVLDRFSDLPDDVEVDEDESGCIPFWPLLQHLLRVPISSTSQLIDRMQTITANAGTCQDNDFGTLKEFVSTRGEGEFFSMTWPKLRDMALDLPTYFPSGQLELLQPGLPLRLSRGQVACLVIHQFLCSSVPQRDDDGYQDLGIWYSSEQRHPAAVKMYLEALFIYFERLPEASDLLQDHTSFKDRTEACVKYELYRKEGEVALEMAKLASVHVSYLATHTTDIHNPEVQGKGGAAVISANKVIGFGQSATQEEIFVGSAPESYPVVLVAPHLTDDTVITVSGTRAMLNVKGQRRQIEWSRVPMPPLTDGVERPGGRLIFMDALEMDMLEPPSKGSLPDLQPENIDREIKKATAGFESYQGDAVFTGLWGCGAFGGDPGVKLIVLWIAAAAAGIRLHIVLGPGEHELGVALERIIKVGEGSSAEKMRDTLLKAPEKLQREGILEWIEQAVSGTP